MKSHWIKFCGLALVIVFGSVAGRPVKAQDAKPPAESVGSQPASSSTEPQVLSFYDLTESTGCMRTVAKNAPAKCLPGTVSIMKLEPETAAVTSNRIHVQPTGDVAKDEKALRDKVLRELPGPNVFQVYPPVNGTASTTFTQLGLMYCTQESTSLTLNAAVPYNSQGNQRVTTITLYYDRNTNGECSRLYLKTGQQRTYSSGDGYPAYLDVHTFSQTSGIGGYATWDPGCAEVPFSPYWRYSDFYQLGSQGWYYTVRLANLSNCFDNVTFNVVYPGVRLLTEHV